MQFVHVKIKHIAISIFDNIWLQSRIIIQIAFSVVIHNVEPELHFFSWTVNQKIQRMDEYRIQHSVEHLTHRVSIDLHALQSGYELCWLTVLRSRERIHYTSAASSQVSPSCMVAMVTWRERGCGRVKSSPGAVWSIIQTDFTHSNNKKQNLPCSG